MSKTPPDPRLNAFRSDLADRRLADTVEATVYTDSRPAVVITAVADVRTGPSSGSGIATQYLLGDRLDVFEIAGGWVWAQGVRDGYVGYIEEQCLSFDPMAEPTHRIAAPRTLLYREPDLKTPPVEVISMGSALAVSEITENRGTRYAVTPGGRAVIAAHLVEIGDHAADYVSSAEMLLHTPYLWGGATGFGIDCSGLVQLTMLMAGRHVLRDSDMQEASIGDPLKTAAGFDDLRRGDLVFWKGHVGVMTGGRDLLHANAHTMSVTVEPLAQAIERIERLYGSPTSLRRP